MDYEPVFSEPEWLLACWILSSVLQDYLNWIIWHCSAVFSLIIIPTHLHFKLVMKVYVPLMTELSKIFITWHNVLSWLLHTRDQTPKQPHTLIFPLLSCIYVVSFNPSYPRCNHPQPATPPYLSLHFQRTRQEDPHTQLTILLWIHPTFSR